MYLFYYRIVLDSHFLFVFTVLGVEDCIVLGFFSSYLFLLSDVGNHIVLDFHSLFVFVGMSVTDHIILHFSFVFILMDVGNLIALDINLLFVFVLGTSKWRKKIVCTLKLLISYFPILKNSVTYRSNSCDSKTRFTSFQNSFLSAWIVNPQPGE